MRTDTEIHYWRIPIPVKTGNGLNNRGNWRVAAARAKRERETACMLTPKTLAERLPVVVTMTRKSAGVLDDDNLQGSLKHIRDGIADAFGVPDNDPRITWRYAQQKCKRGDFGVGVEIEEVHE